MSSKKNTRKVMISLGVVGAAAAVAGMGTFGTFTSTTSGSQSVASGTVKIELGTGANSSLNVPATKLVAGDEVQRAVTLANSGTADLSAVTLTTTAGTSNALTTDATNGLKLKIDACTAAWVPGGAATEPTYTCPAGATASTVLVSKAVLGSKTPITLPTALTAGNTEKLRVTMTLPEDADNNFQNLSTTINYTFDATQRAVGNR